MSHNISTNPFGYGQGVDSVLTVDGRSASGANGKQVSFLFYRGETGLTPGIVLCEGDPRGYQTLSAQAWIEGEDLYAFRELLNEIPDEAFVRPADPVREYVFAVDNDGDWWVEADSGNLCLTSFEGEINHDEVEPYAAKTDRNWGRTLDSLAESYGIDASPAEEEFFGWKDSDGDWWGYNPATNGWHPVFVGTTAFDFKNDYPTWLGFDDGVEEALGEIDPGLPFWSVGDSFRYLATGGVTITYSKTEAGWVRVVVAIDGQVNGALEGSKFDDNYATALASRPRYEVIFRKNAYA